MSRKLTVLTYSTYTVRHAVTLKWLPIVFVRFIQSQRIVRLRQNTVRLQHDYEFDVFLQTHAKSALDQILYAWETYGTVLYRAVRVFKHCDWIGGFFVLFDWFRRKAI
jgi:hypothetical protein